MSMGNVKQGHNQNVVTVEERRVRNMEGVNG